MTSAAEYNSNINNNCDCGDGLKGNTAAPSLVRRILSSSLPSGVLSTYTSTIISPRLAIFLREWLRPVSIAVASLVCLPLSFYTREAGTLPYEIKGGALTEIVIGWDALLHMSIWPIVVVVSAAGFFLAHCDRKGCSAVYCVDHGRCYGSHKKELEQQELLRQQQHQPQKLVGGGAVATGQNQNQSLVRRVISHWPLGSVMTSVVIMSALFSIGASVHSQVQVVSPSWIWNPFMWGGYQVYYPDGIQTELEAVCIDGDLGGLRDLGDIGDTPPHDKDVLPAGKKTVPPLCLKESAWKVLSADGLSSRSPDDVEAVLRGVRYARQPGHGMIVNVMSRDTVDAIGPLRKNVEGLLPFFTKVAVVVFENDSKDGTREALKAWSEEVKDRYVIDVMECDDAKDCVFGESHRYDATEAEEYFKSSAIGRMAEFRQRIVDYILGSDTYAADYSHMMVVDLDLKVSLSPLGVMHSLGKVPNAAVASSGRQAWPGSFGSFVPPYDFSAFRALRSPRNARILDMHQAFCELAPPGDRWRNQCDAVSPMHLMLVLGHDWASGADPYPVASAFNGATIYPLDLVRRSGAKYDDGDDGQQCEHIGFNKSLKKTMYVNPKWNMNINPKVPGGPTGSRAMKNVARIVFTPKISLPIFFQNLGCMLLFVHSVLVLVIKVLYPGWTKILRGTKVKYLFLPSRGAAGMKGVGGAGGKIVDMDYLVSIQPPQSRKRSTSDYGNVDNV